MKMIYMLVEMENKFNCDSLIEERINLFSNKDDLIDFVIKKYKCKEVFINDEDGLILDENMNEFGLYMFEKEVK